MAWKVLVVGANKGGVGKTPLAGWLASTAAELGRKVLAIDVDGNGSLAMRLGCTVDKARTFEEFNTGRCQDPKALLHDTYHKNIQMVPAHPLLDNTPHGVDSQWKVSEFLEGLAEARVKADVVVIDTPPAKMALTVSALLAADGYVVPITHETGSFLAGLLQFDTLVKNCQRSNQRLKEIAVLPTGFNLGVGGHQKALAMAQEKYGSRLYPTVVPHSDWVTYEPRDGQPIITMRPREKITRIVRPVMEDLLLRAGAIAAAPVETPAKPKKAPKEVAPHA
jgi:chromosome partitioning protein